MCATSETCDCGMFRDEKRRHENDDLF